MTTAKQRIVGLRVPEAHRVVSIRPVRDSEEPALFGSAPAAYPLICAIHRAVAQRIARRIA